MKCVVLINAHSRLAAQHVETVQAFFTDSKHFEVLDFVVVENLKDFDSCLERIAQQKAAECVIVGSGDGTIVATINKLRKRHNVVYGFLPLGTSNTFVRSLGIPLRLQEALELLPTASSRQVSLGSINDTLFANIADIGVPAEVADKLTNKVKRYLGGLAYAVSGIRELARHNAIWCELKIDGGKTISFYTHQVLIANGKYRGPLQVTADTSVFSDTLTLGYSDTHSRWQFLRDAIGFITGRTKQRKSLHFVPIKEAVLTTRPAQPIQADGEIIGKTPAKVKVVANAIRVITPEPTQARSRKHRRSRRS